MSKTIPVFVLLLAIFACLAGATPIADGVERIEPNNTRSCQLNLVVTDVRLYATSPGGPFYSASDWHCMSICSPGAGWLGGTRQKSNGYCWCIRQPFGSPASGVYDTDFNSIFNPNTPTYGCQSWTVADQKWMFGSSGTIGPVYAATVAECALWAATNFKVGWTRQRSTTKCWAGTGQSWVPNALLYDTDFDAGVVSPF